jgi:hypothetical protein
LLGGGGGAVLFRHLWLGGKGYGLVTGGFDNAAGTASLSGGGGGLELGFVAVSSRRLMVIPYLGVGGFGTTLEVTNRTADDFVDGTYVLVPAGQRSTFDAGFWTLDAGLRVERLFFWKNSGIAVGGELGFISSFTSPAWEVGNVELGGHDHAGLDGVYLRLTLGGGGFWFR